MYFWVWKFHDGMRPKWHILVFDVDEIVWIGQFLLLVADG